MVNEWLKAAEILTSILPCMHGRETHLPFCYSQERRFAYDLQYTDFPHFTENEYALDVKAALGGIDRYWCLYSSIQVQLSYMTLQAERVRHWEYGGRGCDAWDISTLLRGLFARFRFKWTRWCLENWSGRAKVFPQPGSSHTYGRTPVCVRSYVAPKLNQQLD